MGERSISPFYAHDCTACRFVGHYDGCDCYIHEQHGQKTAVMRMSDKPDGYAAWDSRGLEPLDLGYQILKMGEAPRHG